jgi:hypothetical protein
MATELVARAIAQQDWLDPVADMAQPAIDRALTAAGGQPLKDFLNGVWLGHPLHLVLTDIPIGAWTMTAVLDALRGRMAPSGARPSTGPEKRSAPRAGQRLGGVVASRWRPQAQSLRGRDRRS